MNWFRLYNEARNDAKLRSLTDAQHRVWFNLLCFAAEQKDRGIIANADPLILALEVSSGDEQVLSETLDRLERLRIIAREGDSLVFLNFVKRQYDKPSDAPGRVSERVSRHRAKGVSASKRDETPTDADVTPGNALYSEAEVYAETEREEANAIALAEAPAPPPAHIVPLPKQKGLTKPTETECLEYFTQRGRPELSETFWNYWQSVSWKRQGRTMTDWKAAVREWISKEGPKPTALSRGRASPRLEPGQSANSAVTNEFLTHLRSVGVPE